MVGILELNTFRFSHLMLSVLIPDGMHAIHLTTLMVSHVMSLIYQSGHPMQALQVGWAAAEVDSLAAQPVKNKGGGERERERLRKT